MGVPLNIDWQQILLHLMNFAILAGGLYVLLYRPVKAFMAKREAYYQAQADQAEKTAQEAERLKADYQAKLDAAGEEILQEKKRAAQAAQASAQRQLEDAKAQAEKILSDACGAQPGENRGGSPSGGSGSGGGGHGEAGSPVRRRCV